VRLKKLTESSKPRRMGTACQTRAARAPRNGSGSVIARLAGGEHDMGIRGLSGVLISICPQKKSKLSRVLGGVQQQFCGRRRSVLR
jgi:hypothetical protein